MKRLLRSALCFLPLAALLVFVNWYADPANVLRGGYERQVAEIVASGQNAANLRNMDDRAFLREYAALRTQPVGTLALGSSHCMQITAALTGDPDTFCAGVTGADLRDCISIYRLFRESGLAPQRVILTVDAWFLCDNTLEGRAMTDGYLDFCAEHGLTPYGEDGLFSLNRGWIERKSNFLSIPYFQSSLDYLKKGLHRTRDAVPTQEHAAAGAMRRADGSYCYEQAYREASAEQVEQLARDCIAVPPQFAKDFTGVTEGLVEQLRAFLQELQADGVQAAVMLSPYHPLYYAYMRETPQPYGQILSTETRVRQLAAELSIPVFGANDPAACGLDETDFYDGLHCSEEAMYRFYPADLFAQEAA